MNAVLIVESQVFSGFEFKLNLNDLEDVVLLTYQVKDIRNLGNNNASYSKTLTLPGTSENNLFFNSIFDFTVDSSFDANRRANARIEIDSVVIFKGYLQLNKILNNNGNIEYEITLYSSLSDFITKLGNYTLADLDFSEFNHDYVLFNVVGSWETFFYKNNIAIPFNPGEGYVYPYIDYGQSQYDLSNGKQLEFFKPQFYLKVLVDKIFDKAGYTYSSNFFNSTDFRKMLVINSDTSSFLFDEDLLEANRIRVSRQLSEATIHLSIQPPYITQFQTPDYDIPFNNDVSVNDYNPNGYWSLINDEYTAPTTGYYDINLNALLNNRIRATSFPNNQPISGGTITWTLVYDFNIEIVKIDANNNSTVVDLFFGAVAEGGVMNINGELISNSANANFTSSNIYLLQNERVKIKINYFVRDYDVRFGLFSTPTVLSFLIMEDSFVEITQKANRATEVGSNPFDENGKYFKNNDSTLSEVFLDVCRMFNLHITDNNDRPSDLFIEPYDNFYTNNVIDLTQKLDREQEIGLTPTYDLTERTIYLTYAEENDFYNQSYLTSTSKIWGQYEYIVENDFVDRDSENRIEFTNFAPSPLIREGDKFLTPLYDRDDSGGKSTLDNTKLRLLYYDKTIPCSTWIIKDLSTGLDSTYTAYPYAGHLDNPFTPTNDLNPFFCVTYFYPNFIGTNNNLYNKFYYNYFFNKLNKNTFLLEGFFKLNSYDIYSFDFRDIYYIDGSYWILNKIIDYNPANPDLTKLELVKLLINNVENAKFFGSDITYSNPGGGGFSPTNGYGFRYGGEIQRPVSPDSVGLGFNNRIKDKGNLIAGSNSQIGDKAFGNIISGQNNKVAGGSTTNMMNGKNNILAGTNNFVHGNDNKFLTNNSFVVGNNIKNVSNDAFIIAVPTINQPDVVNASTDEVLSPFGEINNNILIVNGSVDTVRQIGGLSSVVIIQAPIA